MIDPAEEFRKHAADCRRMARAQSNAQAKDSWIRLAKRWDICAELAEQESASACRLVPKQQGQARSHRHVSR